MEEQKNNVEETKKKSPVVGIVIVVIIAVLCVGLGIYVGKTYVGKSETTDKEQKTSEKDSNKEAEKEKEKEKVPDGCVVCDETGGICCGTKDPENTPKIPDGCVVCDETGGLCCGTTGPVDTKERKVDLLSEARGKDEYNTKFDLQGKSFEYIKKDDNHIVKVNDKELFNKYGYNVTGVGLLGNGMVVIEYYFDLDQVMARIREYYDTNLNLVKKMSGISSKYDILSMEFEYAELSDECINDEYRLVKIYKATIKDKTIDTSLVREEKQENCAGMV